MDINPDLVVFSRPDSVFAECCRFLRAKITRPAPGNPPRSILVTSALMGEGKTFVSCNLAASISRTPDEHVLLVDADIRKPDVHRIFGIPAEREGLSAYLEGKASLPGLLYKTPFDKLAVLPAGNSISTPAELLSSARMKELIQELADHYHDRFVILDSPPLGLAPESSVIANTVDAVLLVVLHGQTPRNAVKDAVKRIPKAKLMGIVYNTYDDPIKLYDRYGYYNYGYGKANK
jgi:exopolysaccharide/PEP-CTERM locus tyrosine autokinase